MCGIFGWIPIGPSHKSDMNQVAAEIMAEMECRGPDDYGYAIFDQTGQVIGDESHRDAKTGTIMLGHTRLAILDLSAAGHQPMLSHDKRYCIVFNGEIYNYKELRAELEQEGIEFYSNSDTEVLLNAYKKWKKNCLSKFVGMYAFAIYDTHAKKLFCARDNFGIKPFFWTYGDFGFCFASEMPALLRVPGVPRKVSARGAYNFLATGSVENNEHTMIEGVSRLMPAYWMDVNVAAMTSTQSAPPLERVARFHRYWNIPLDNVTDMRESDAVEQLRAMFLDSIKLHLRSDVPLGVALSGGIDSSSVACAIRHLEPDADLHAFGYVADDPTISEEAWIRLAATGSRAVCHTTKPSAGDLLRDLDTLILRQGEPFATTSIYASYAVMKLAHENGVKVILEGQGADELFAGYSFYVGGRFHSIADQDSPEQAIAFLETAAEWPGREKVIGDILSIIRASPPKAPTLSPAGSVLCFDAFKERAVRGETRMPSFAYRHNDIMRAAMASDTHYTSVPQLMRHGDRNAMTFSLENRVPFLTPQLAEFAFSLPEKYLLDDHGCTKSILRKAMRGIVPDETLDRRDKIGFEAPGLPWLQTLMPWVIQNFLETRSVFLSSKDLISLWKGIIRGTVEFDWFYWRVLCYCRWKELLNLEE